MASTTQQTPQSRVLRHVLTASQFSRDDIDEIYTLSDRCRNIVETDGGCDVARGKILANVFYEPSTRTSGSFHAAMLRLGGSVIPMTNTHTSSVAKGESLADTVRCLECYCDVMVLRHPEIGSATEAAKYLSIPLLNGGDGAGEHPTQALLDVYTIRSELNKIDDLTITLVGDLKHGRTVHSLVQLLALTTNVTLVYVCPEGLEMPAYIVDELQGYPHVRQSVERDLNVAITTSDVVYVTRIQKERLSDVSKYESYANAYCITPQLMESAPSKCIIMHPLPRVNEIDPNVDTDPRAVYFKQMRYGMYVRMALLWRALGIDVE